MHVVQLVAANHHHLCTTTSPSALLPATPLSRLPSYPAGQDTSNQEEPRPSMMRHCNAQLEATTRVASSPAARGRGCHPDHESQTTTTSDRRSIPPANPTEGQINRPTTHASEDVAPPTPSLRRAASHPGPLSRLTHE
jgi:hypothetical protein